MLRLLSIMQLSQKFSHKYGWGSWLLYSSHSQELRAAGSEAVWALGSMLSWESGGKFYTSFATTWVILITIL